MTLIRRFCRSVEITSLKAQANTFSRYKIGDNSIWISGVLAPLIAGDFYYSQPYPGETQNPPTYTTVCHPLTIYGVQR